MLLYLITLMKILKKELPQSQETFDRAFGLEEGMLEDLRKFIQN
jgi:FKBP-type peptidyl-prolyl cis-trans isomerase (trigger factor)